jgi:hypothetical protein
MSYEHSRPDPQLNREALLTAKRPDLQPLIDHLPEVARGRDDIRTDCARVVAGWWFTNTARRREDLIAAGLLMLRREDPSTARTRAYMLGCVCSEPCTLGRQDGHSASRHLTIRSRGGFRLTPQNG